MNNTSSLNPIVDTALNIAVNINRNLQAIQLMTLQSLFCEYVNDQVTREKVENIVLKIVRNVEPLNEIDEILKCANKPKVDSVNSNDGSEVSSSSSSSSSSLSSSSSSSCEIKKKKFKSWTLNDDRRLIFAVHKFGEVWPKVADFVGNNRSRSMCSQRWLRVVNPRLLKSEWRREEEIRLIELVNIYGTKSWVKVSADIGNRSDVQCRYWYRHLEQCGKVQQIQNLIEKRNENNELSQLNQQINQLNQMYQENQNNNDLIAVAENDGNTFLDPKILCDDKEELCVIYCKDFVMNEEDHFEEDHFKEDLFASDNEKFSIDDSFWQSSDNEQDDITIQEMDAEFDFCP